MAIQEKNLKPIIALFDIDGVLIQPGGYRAAVKATLDYFFQQMGLELEIDENEIASLYESYGVTSEWDMIPLTISLALNHLASDLKSDVVLSKLFQLPSSLPVVKSVKKKIDLLSEIRRIKGFFQNSRVASEVLYAANVRLKQDGPFPVIFSDPVVAQLLKDTRHPERSITYQVFQNYVLGSECFLQTYHLPPIVETGSMLALYDSPLLRHEWVESLETAKYNEKIWYSGLTARPSLVPIERKPVIGPYSPEAEMAIGLLGFKKFPLIGYGRIHFLAEQIHADADSLIKPSPLQALAGIASAWTSQEWPALLWGAQIYGSLNGGWGEALITEGYELNRELPRSFELHIFEDTPIGILSTCSAAEILREQGHEIDIYKWGIAYNHDKIRALNAVGATVFEDVNDAVKQAFFS